MIYDIAPQTKPRMTQRDGKISNRIGVRPCVQRYWDFKERVRTLNIQVPVAGAHVVFWVEMPKSWSKKKKAEMCGKPHQQTPDWDNFAKGLFDAIYEDDSVVYDCRVSKYWAYTGKIEVRHETETD